MGLGQVGVVVPGMMSVVVNQSHFLERKQHVVSMDYGPQVTENI